MAGMYQKMYKEKPKRVRDPSLPPPPNLLSHDKTIRGMNQDLSTAQVIMQRQQEEISSLRRKVDQLSYRLDSLTNYIKKLK